MENKNSYFLLDIHLPNNKITNEIYQDQLRNSVDLVLASMGVEEEPEEYEKEEVNYKAEGVTKAFLNEQLLITKNKKKRGL